MTAMTEPFPPWLRDLTRFFNAESTASAFVPPADVLVSDEGVSVYMDVPGVRADMLDIELENDMLSIRGERPFPYRDEGDGAKAIRRIERGFGRFERSLRVTGGLDADAIEASLTDGVLHLRIPRPESLKPRRIEIRAGASEPQQVGAGGQPAASEQPAGSDQPAGSEQPAGSDQPQ